MVGVIVVFRSVCIVRLFVMAVTSIQVTSFGSINVIGVFRFFSAACSTAIRRVIELLTSEVKASK